MMKARTKVAIVLAGGTGYVLGARAGRERYEQIVAMASRISGDPRVRSVLRQGDHGAPSVGPEPTEPTI